MVALWTGGAAAAPVSTTSPKSIAPAAKNPILLENAPDPGVVRHGGKWYVYSTSSSRKGKFAIVESTDLKTWSPAGNIFTPETLPAWASESRNWWAPEVHKVGEKFIAYYTARANSDNRFAIGAAVADGPTGPFRDKGTPLKFTEGVGLIDVTTFLDPVSQKRFLIWKEDRNDFKPPEPTPILMQEMTSDGLALRGPTREILRNDQKWEGDLVEAPSLIYRHGWYYLIYSANGFAGDAYAVGVARSRDIWGPYEKKPRPILRDDADFSGPGHQFVIQDEKGRWHMFYHARLKKSGLHWRFLMHDYMTFDKGGWPKINDGRPGAVRPGAVEEAQRKSSRPTN